jgi:hypothetical protein
MNVLYIVEFKDCVKVGVSCQVKERIKVIERMVGEKHCKVRVFKEYYEESRILESLEAHRLVSLRIGASTEFFHNSCIDKLEELVCGFEELDFDQTPSSRGTKSRYKESHSALKKLYKDNESKINEIWTGMYDAGVDVEVINTLSTLMVLGIISCGDIVKLFLLKEGKARVSLTLDKLGISEYVRDCIGGKL